MAFRLACGNGSITGPEKIALSTFRQSIPAGKLHPRENAIPKGLTPSFKQSLTAKPPPARLCSKQLHCELSNSDARCRPRLVVLLPVSGWEKNLQVANKTVLK